MIRKLIIAICLLLGTVIHSNLWSQILSEEWKFQTKDRILSSPVLDNQMLYFGSEDGNFYAIDKNSGKELWHYTTRGHIQSTATVVKNIVFFESGNVYYALNKISGEELWTYDPGSALWGYKIDPYDDKRSKAIVNKGVLYVGSSLGYLYGFDAESGEKVFTINSDYGQPIRTTPCINNDMLYFGDWSGKIYAYDLIKKVFL
jgi:outer membrane protein assembly factor BamB